MLSNNKLVASIVANVCRFLNTSLIGLTISSLLVWPAHFILRKYSCAAKFNIGDMDGIRKMKERTTCRSRIFQTFWKHLVYCEMMLKTIRNTVAESYLSHSSKTGGSVAQHNHCIELKKDHVFHLWLLTWCYRHRHESVSNKTGRKRKLERRELWISCCKNYQFQSEEDTYCRVEIH